MSKNNSGQISFTRACDNCEEIIRISIDDSSFGKPIQRYKDGLSLSAFYTGKLLTFLDSDMKKHYKKEHPEELFRQMIIMNGGVYSGKGTENENISIS